MISQHIKKQEKEQYRTCRFNSELGSFLLLLLHSREYGAPPSWQCAGLVVALPDPVEADRLAAVAVPGLRDRSGAAAAPAKFCAPGGHRQAATPGNKSL